MVAMAIQDWKRLAAEYNKRRRKWRRVTKVLTGISWPKSFRHFPMFGSFDDEQQQAPRWDTRVFISEGGWIGCKWMTTDELWAALDRWVKRSYATAPPESAQLGGLYQCGGCRFFGAFDSDYGLCCNPLSVNDGRVVFEHGGCEHASGIEELKQHETSH